MADFDYDQLNIEKSSSLTDGFLVCDNIPLLKRTLERNVVAVQKYMLWFFNCNMDISYTFTIEGH